MATRRSAQGHHRDASLPVALSSAADDSASSGTEAFVPRRFPNRVATENDSPQRKPTTSTSAQNISAAAPQKSNFAGRRRSTVRDHKPLMGPRAMDQSRRIVSGSTTASNNNPSRLPTSASEPQSLTAPTNGSNPRFSFGKLPSRAESQSSTSDFLPSFNFDDFHESIGSGPKLSEFPVPGGGRTMFALEESDNDTVNSVASFADRKRAVSRAPSSSSFAGRPGTSQRRQAASRTDSEAGSMGPPTAPASNRARRQSQVRGPRKSIGPGFTPNASDIQPQFGPRRELSHGNFGRALSPNKPNRRGTLVPSRSATDVPRLAAAQRSSKAKSMVAPSTQSYSSLISEFGRTTGPARSPSKSTGQKAGTPSNANKRGSLHHAGGLGARTISPTDARRLKRLSISQSTPAMPRDPPTPQPEMPQEHLTTPYSQTLALRKSVTPSSSARNTPDHIPRPVGAGTSLPNSSSLNSLRGNANLPSRSSQQILSTSRLPTPKPRNVHSSAGTETEDVPPVPAIPKAFESPNTEIDQPVYPERQGPATPGAEGSGNVTLIQNTESDSSNLSSIDQSVETATKDTRKTRSLNQRRRGLTVGDSEGDRTASSTSGTTGKKNLQPLRLPPLNLLPLSTPTAKRIASFQPSEGDGDGDSSTPPPKRNYTKTPSTPLTASKATFGFRNEGETPIAAEMRSSTSHYHLRSTETPSLPPPIPSKPITTPNARNAATTPYGANSLPKLGAQLDHLVPKESDEFDFGKAEAAQQTHRQNPPRAQNIEKPHKLDTASVTSTEPETPSSSSSIRRKLSLSNWKRSSSKSSHRAQASQGHVPYQASSDAPSQSPKHSDMAPPRLPTSTTWSGPVSDTETVVKPRPSYEAATRRKPSSTLFASDTEAQKSRNGERKASAGKPATNQANAYTGPVTRSSSSQLMHKMLGSKNSISTLKARSLDTNLDREDLAADEEMRRLAARRKDFEHAAKEVDELRKRAKPQDRVSPATAIQMVPLNIFERGEIIDYKDIYFCGTKHAKKHVGDLHAQTANFGYDDDRGDYNIVLGDHLAYRYEVVDVLGKGSFGQVVRCIDHKLGKLVAVKIIRNKKRFHQQALVEVNILQKLREWDPENKHSMISFTQHFYFRGHLCISTELLGMNLYEFIKAHDFKGFSLKLIRRFARQILSSLVLLKGKRVIHCDLKPENILLAHPLHSEIKVIDFGSSCFEHEKVYTYIQSRFYRSPEVILGMNYGLPIDMWSFGCILAELLTGSPIFPGENEQEQLACIMEIFGPPEKHLIEKSSRKKLFFDSLGKPRVTVSSKGRRRRPSSKTLEQSLKCNDEAFLDFIARCLRWDPERRLKPDEAMQHEFITGIKRPRGGPRSTINGGSAASHSNSPVRRMNTVAQTPQRGRPLPEPPATSFKNAQGAANVQGNAAPTGSRNVSGNNGSPAKVPGRRHSTVSNLHGNLGIRRASKEQSSGSSNTGASSNQSSGLPRVAQRSISGKPDLASAAAVASLVKDQT
ncbi:hypothetical protein IWX92DRAFT_168455 [Phyllosticta citricarpa]